MFINLIEIILSLLLIIIGVGFITLVDRSTMGYSQNRKSPNKVSMFGLFQSILDGIKLLTKEMNYLDNINYVMFMLSQLISFIIMIMLWSITTLMFEESSKVSLLFMMCILSLSIFSKLFIGFSSSKMSIIGSIRSIMQTIGYELIMNMLMYILMILIMNYMMNNMMLLYMNYNILFMVSWLMMVLCESIRIPFDMVESESELISGYNTEYSSLGVVLIFMSEYGNMYFMSMFNSFLFGLNMFTFIMSLLILLWIKSVFVRIKYDFMMGLLWMSTLQLITFLLIIMLFI